MAFWQKIVSFLNPAHANSQSLKIEQLSIWALEVFVAAFFDAAFSCNDRRFNRLEIRYINQTFEK